MHKCQAELLQIQYAHEILEFLNEEKKRCTYKAIGDVIGVYHRNVNERYLGKRREEASWVVRKRDGLPSGYSPDKLHPLFRKKKVIESGDALKRKFEKWKARK